MLPLPFFPLHLTFHPSHVFTHSVTFLFPLYPTFHLPSDFKRSSSLHPSPLVSSFPCSPCFSALSLPLTFILPNSHPILHPSPLYFSLHASPYLLHSPSHLTFLTSSLLFSFQPLSSPSLPSHLIFRPYTLYSSFHPSPYLLHSPLSPYIFRTSPLLFSFESYPYLSPSLPLS